jgi:hypothetical protein
MRPKTRVKRRKRKRKRELLKSLLSSKRAMFKLTNQVFTQMIKVFPTNKEDKIPSKNQLEALASNKTYKRVKTKNRRLKIELYQVLQSS